jgi:eukaryotic-like serine/threonine-protein kinase
MIGQKIGRYQIQKMIGAGGMGEVYLAMDTMLNRTVALKFLPKELESRERVVKRFLREAQATARLAHPNIATLYGIEEHEGRYFILMEYIQGDPLSRLMRRERLKVKNVLIYAEQIADALAEAHEHGVLHRDIKPGNIMITRKQKVKVLDFGLAKFIGQESDLSGSGGGELLGEDLTRDGMLVGTPRYMAPEQILGKAVDVRSDIFAFGIILYEMLAGRHPFKVENNAQLIVAITTQSPPPLRDFNPEMPEELIEVVMKALAKSPQARYQTIGQMRDELRALSAQLYADGYFEYSDSSGIRSEEPRQRSITPNADPRQNTILSEPEPTIDAAQNPDTIRAFGRNPVRLVALAIALFLFAAGLGTVLVLKRSKTSEVTSPVRSGRPLIAVMYFDNLTNDPKLDWLSGGLTEMFTTDLAQINSIEVVSKQRLLDTLQVLGKSDGEKIDKSIVSEVARKVGAQNVLSGSVLKINTKLRLNITLAEVDTGKIVISDSVEGSSIDEIFSLVDAIAARISRHYSPVGKPTEEPKLVQMTTNSVEAFRLYSRGLERCWRTNFDEGIDDLERAVQIDDQFAIAYLQIGNAKSVRNDMTGARAAIEKALKNIDRASYREQLLIRGVNAFFQGYDTGIYEPALMIFEQMEADYPNDKEVHLWKGLSHWRNGDYKKAVSSYQRILELDPYFNEMYVSLARAYADDEDYLLAASTMRKSIALYPGQPDGRNLLGNVYTRMSRYDDAINEYKAVLDIKESYYGYRAYLNLAQIYFLKNEAAKGHEILDKYLKLTDDLTGKAWAYLVLYRYAIAEGKAAEAERHLNSALANARKTGDVRIGSIALCYQSDFNLFMNKKGEAVKAAREAVSSAGLELGGREAIQQLALALLEQSDEKAAIASMEDYFAKLTGNNQKSMADVRRVIDGEIAFRSGDFARSQQLWQPPLKYNIRLYWKIGLAAYNARNYDLAAEQFKKLIKRDGFDPERRGAYWSYQNPEYTVVLAHYYLGRIEQEKGKRNEARKEYEQFLSAWGQADFPRPEIEDAKARLKQL